MFVSICDLSGIETDFFKRIQSHRTIIRILGALFPPVWIVLNLTILLPSRGFIDSEICDYTSKGRLLMNLTSIIPIICFSLLPLFFISPVLLPGPPPPSSSSPQCAFTSPPSSTFPTCGPSGICIVSY